MESRINPTFPRMRHSAERSYNESIQHTVIVFVSHILQHSPSITRVSGKTSRLQRSVFVKKIKPGSQIPAQRPSRYLHLLRSDRNHSSLAGKSSIHHELDNRSERQAESPTASR